MPTEKREDRVGVERRRFPRYSVIASAEATDVNSQTRIKARINDLGRGGCYVDTINPFAVGTEVNIRVTRQSKLFSAHAKVLYSTLGMGMGLMFTAVEPGEILVLEKWLEELSGESASIEASEDATVQDQSPDAPEKELRDVVNDLIKTLGRKGMLTHAESEAMLRKFSKS